MACADIADHRFFGILENDRPVGCNTAPVLIHFREEPGSKTEHLLISMISGKMPASSECPHLTCNPERDRDLLTFPRGQLSLDPSCRLDRDPPFIHVKDPPELPFRDEDRPSVDRSHHK